MTNEEADEQILQQQIQQLEKWAAGRVKPWCGLCEDDYDFRSWAAVPGGEKVTKERLQAGCLYEYARESRKLRCLLALMNPARQRQAFEITTAPVEWGSREQIQLDCSFQDLNEHDAESVLGGWIYSLADLADYLADNVSFGELFRTKRNELESAFDGLDSLERVRREHLPFRRVNAVDFAWESEQWQATVQETLGDQPYSDRSDQRKRIIREDGSEVVAIEIRWRDFTDKDIGVVMEGFARAHRPQNAASKAPQRRGRGKRNEVQSALDALSAMRLASYYPKSSRGQRAGLRDTFGASHAIDLFSEIRFVRVGLRSKRKSPEFVEQTNFDSLTAEARKLFLQTFPFGESAENALTWSKRRRVRKSGMISS
jgi:hypothetical protein